MFSFTFQTELDYWGYKSGGVEVEEQNAILFFYFRTHCIVPSHDIKKGLPRVSVVCKEIFCVAESNVNIQQKTLFSLTDLFCCEF